MFELPGVVSRTDRVPPAAETVIPFRASMNVAPTPVREDAIVPASSVM
jgi:hypothetical protein